LSRISGRYRTVLPVGRWRRRLLPAVGMGPLVDFLQLGDAHLGVDLGGVEPGVAEQDLDGADVRPVVVHVRGAAVAEQVTASGLLDAGLFHRPLDPVADVVRIEPGSVSADEEGAFVEFDFEPGPGFLEVYFHALNFRNIYFDIDTY